MADTESFRQQHTELLATLAEISPKLTVGKLTIPGNGVRVTLAKLSGKLANHLAHEERDLYPVLAAHGDANVAAMAQRFADEMLPLRDALHAYFTKWARNGLLESSPRDFIRETNALFEALGERLRREDEELLPALDSVV